MQNKRMFFWHVLTDDQLKEIQILLWDTNGRVIRPGVIQRSVIYNGVEFVGEVLYCQKCSAEKPNGFMVYDHVWNPLKIDGIICQPCFEKLLGRELTTADLHDYPINREIITSLLMADPA